MYSCEVQHTVTSTDPQYITLTKNVPKIFIVEIVNDDHANINLWTVNPETKAYDYDVKFIGPLNILEGGSITYGIKLDSEPRLPVTIYPNITSNQADNILLQPELTAVPSIITIDNTNWDKMQSLKFHNNLLPASC